MIKIGFVTDSTCDLPGELVEKWGIGVVPAFVNYDGQSYADDGIELKREGFYEKLPEINPLPTTAAPSPGIAEEMVQQAASDADHVFILTAPVKLSGIYNAMRLAANSLPADRVTLIDSGTVSMSLGWQVLAGAQAAAASGDVKAVRAAIERTRAQQKIYAGLATLEFLRRSGRVGWASASIGSLLGIKPIITVENGDVNSVERVRTFKRAMRRMSELVHDMAPLERLAIGHGQNADGAQELQAMLADVAPSDTLMFSITPALGVHTGPGVLGAAAVQQAGRQ